jgi:23S rRNA (uracil1939-C5)-methyltransferase
MRAEKLVYEGHALARLDGMVCFIDGALPGELVDACVTRRAARHGFARLVQVIEPSPARRPPACPSFGLCGGCHLLHLDYAAQLEAKRGFVAEALRFLGPSAPSVGRVIGMDPPVFFRNKMSFSVGTRDGTPVCGLHERDRFDRIVDATSCVLQSEASREILRKIQGFLASGRLAEARWPRRVEIREGRRTGERMVLLGRDEGGFPFEPWPDLLAGLATTVVAAVPPRGTLRVLTGPGVLHEQLGGMTFEIGPRDFFQTNTDQAERLFTLVAERVRALNPRRVLDLYAGTGTITAFLARAAGEVVGVESHAPSVESAIRNARRNGLGNVRMIRGDAARMAASLPGGFDVVVVDPPRAGLPPEARRAVIETRAPAVLYVSCNPATLGRDLRDFAAAGLRPEWIQPVDMFPQSFHVETVVELRR